MTFEEISAAEKLEEVRSARARASEATRMLSHVIGEAVDDPFALGDAEVKKRLVAAQGWLVLASEAIHEALR